MAEPKDWTKEIEEALRLISDGSSIRKACEAAKISKATFLALVPSDQYAKARDSCADAHFDGMLDLELDCLKGKVDPHVFRVVMDSRKWRVARMKPKAYSDKTDIHITGSLDISDLEAARERARNRSK